jgi:hypothetical protein
MTHFPFECISWVIVASMHHCFLWTRTWSLGTLDLHYMLYIFIYIYIYIYINIYISASFLEWSWNWNSCVKEPQRCVKIGHTVLLWMVLWRVNTLFQNYHENNPTKYVLVHRILLSHNNLIVLAEYSYLVLLPGWLQIVQSSAFLRAAFICSCIPWIHKCHNDNMMWNRL